MTESSNPEPCPICKEDIDNGSEVSTIGQKGANGINAASTQRGDRIVVEAGVKVHTDCRKHYTNPQQIKTKLSANPPISPAKKRTRDAKGLFNNKTDCFFCGVTIQPESSDYSNVKTDTFADSILKCCDNRSDDWATTVKGRIEYFCGDLHAADCIYHHSCSINFRTDRDVPRQYRSCPPRKGRKSGRPRNQDQEQAFLEMCFYLEANDEEQLTVSDLGNKMKEFLTDKESTPYGNQYLKQQLMEQYGDSVYIAEGVGVHDIVTMREKTSQILRSYFKSHGKEEDEEAQKRAIIKTAARLIRSDIKTNVPSTSDEYPSIEMLKLDSALNYIPGTLHTLLDLLLVGQNKPRKVASIGQALIQAARPRAVLAPLQVGLGVQAHHLHRSKLIVETLSAMGFCSSYKEVLRFEKNAACCVAPDMLGLSADTEDTSVLFAGDNVDHDIITIDGKGTFHGMGMIAALTPARNTKRIITRRKLSELNVTENTQVDIIQYRFAKHACRSVKFKHLPTSLAVDMKVDIFWELALSYKQSTPNWQGMMHMLHRGKEHSGKSSVQYLPMIDLYSGDKTCILSTLNFIYNLASKHNISPVITFDQPLYWKAAEIILDEPQNSPLKGVILLLGCFHTFMNLLGAIGTLMKGTGLTNILESVYGENTVVHMMTGKAVQRAFRGHLLTDKCLNHLIVSETLEANPEFASLVEESEEIYSSLIAGETTLEDVALSDTLATVQQEVNKVKMELQSSSKTSQLWLQYQDMLRCARSLIMADRTGSWRMHLQAVTDCLPIFAAAGHFNYLKSAYYYLQEMSELENRHPDVYKKFLNGRHVVRRSNKFWAGLSSDLVIEQTLMRSLKTSGGLTHGSGMNEEQRSLWTMSMPVTAMYNMAMQDFNNLTYTTSDQHKETTDARLNRDIHDLAKINSKLIPFTPFSEDGSLRNIVTGIEAPSDTNVHEYKAVGMNIINKMVGQAAFQYSFKRKDKAKTLGDSSSVPIAPDRTIDPALLFQRFIVVSQTGVLSMQEVMKHELSTYPPALFDARHIFREADKPQIATAITEHASSVTSGDYEVVKESAPKTDHYVLDGGSLLHRVPWKAGDSYGSIAQSYADFTIRHYGLATVVFDGYGGLSIKDNTHQRRGMNVHPVVHFTADTEFIGKKEKFLSRASNKEGLISLISAQLRNRGCNVIQAPGDADVDIVKTAVDSSHRHSTTLIGEDTDLLILLLHYADTDPDIKDLYFRSDKTDATKVHDINRLKAIIGPDICSQLLFIHAFTGCDSTSRIFGIGKKAAFQKLVKGQPIIKECANCFILPNQTDHIIKDLGNKAMTVMFGNDGSSNLETLRYNTFVKKITSAKSFVHPERLPPTTSSTKFHCLRVYYQIMVWMGTDDGMDALDWGWKVDNNQMVPIMTEMKAAPDNLLKMIHCNCESCPPRCSCRRYGLPCHAGCGPCQTGSCDNPYSNHIITDDDIESDSDEL